MKTEIQSDPIKGRGVYATEKILRDEIIEICELIIVDLDDVSGALEGYVYQYSKSKAAIALGNGSLYNHAKNCNADFYYDSKKRYLYIRAKKTIKSGQEITINYRYDASSKRKFRIRE